MPVIPHKEAGCLIEPPVSVPVAAGTIPAATAAAEPPELPPGTKFCTPWIMYIAIKACFVR